MSIIFSKFKPNESARELYFHELIKNISTALSDNQESAKEFYRTYFENCHPFVFSPTHNEVSEVPLSDVRVDLPYPVIHIEVRDKYISIPRPDDEYKGYTCSFFVAEIAPREYKFLTYCEIHQPGQIARLIHEVTREENEEAWKAFNSLLSGFLKRLSVEKMGHEGTGPSIKLGSGKNKKLFRPRPITFVYPKKLMTTAMPTTKGKVIDWSHRWEVRGHWRKVSGIGKDRSGTYSVIGFTWINNHERGPEDAPLIKKLYVVKDQDAS